MALPRGSSVLPLVLGLSLAAACGDPPAPPVDEVPSAAASRSFWGLNPGSCWVYRVNGMRLFASVTTSPANESVIAGSRVYLQSYRGPGLGLTDNWYFDAETPGEIKLARLDQGQSGMRVTKIYDAARPVFAKLELDSKREIAFTDTRIETMTTPMVGMNDGPRMAGQAELHRWTVLGKPTDAGQEVPLHDGTMKGAFKLQYSRSPTETALYYLVPGYGFASFTDFSSTNHEVCAARICDADGNNCTGADSCTSMVCP